MNDYSPGTNIPIPPQIGVYNDFVAPISTQDIDSTPKKDSVRGFLILVLILTIFLAIAAFIYSNFLSKEVEGLKNNLVSFDSSQPLSTFDKNLDDMRLLSKKLKLINAVYDSKLYVAGMLLPTLESMVESNQSSYVYFSKFNLKRDDKSNLASVSLSGVAFDYLSLYRQINNFKNNNLIKNFKLEGLSVNQNSNVDFDISFNIDISTGSYLNFLNKEINSSVLDNKNSSGPLFKKQNPSVVIPENPTSTASSTQSYSTSTSQGN